MTRSLESRRKRAHYRSWHRGQKEMDVILGRFADAHVADFGADLLGQYEVILDLPDPDLFSWLVGFQPMPEDVLQNAAMQLLLNEHTPES